MIRTRAASTHSPEPLPDGFSLVVAGRFTTNVAIRSVYPFLPTIAAGLGVSLLELGSALALRELVGLTAPLIGGRIDRSDLGVAMAVGLALAAIAATLTATADGVVQFTLALALLSAAKNLYDVSATAWIAHSVPFRHRGRAIGIVEISWAASFLVAMPVVALVIRAGTWRTPYLLLGLATLPISIAILARLRGHVVPRRVRSGRAARVGLLAAPVAAVAFLGVGHQALLVSFASWLEDRHGLTVASLGLTAVVLGAAELVGTTASTRLADRLGKRRCVLIGTALLVPAVAVLPAGGWAVAVALAVLALVLALFEFTFVSMLPLVSEIDPTARATAIAWTIGAFGSGHALGAILGAAAYDAAGIGAVAGIGAAAFGAATIVVALAVNDPG